MDNESSLLSQEEVDALFKKATGKSIGESSTAAAAASPPAPKPAAAPSPPPKAAAPSPPPPPPPPAPMAASRPTPVAAPAPKVAPEPAPVRVVAAGPSADGLKEIKTALATLTQRLAALEARVVRVEQAKVSPQKGSSPAEVKRLTQELKKTAVQVEKIKCGLENTPGYNLRAGFVCEECGAPGLVATLHRCNACGKEGWYGWWPRQEK